MIPFDRPTRLAALLICLTAASSMAATTAPREAKHATSSSPAAAPRTRQVLPWIDDDYDRALAEGRSRGVPVFIEAWAPW